MSVEVDPNVESHFRVTVDLRRLSGFLEAYNVYCRFSYALFDSQRQSISGPPVPVSNAGDADVLNGFFSCEFTTTESHLASSLASTPLLIQIWDAPSVAGRDAQSRLKRIADLRQSHNDDGQPHVRPDDTFIGAAVINFASLLHAPWFLTDRAEYRIPVRVSDCVCPVLPPPHPELQRAAAQCGDFDLARLVAELGAGAVEPVEPIAALRLTISLEHFGLAGAPEAAAAAAASAAASGVISEGAPRLADLAASYATRQLASAGASADGADGGDAGEGGASLLQQQLHQQQQQMHQAHFASQQQLMHPHLAASAPSAAAYDAHAHYAYQQQHQFEPHAQQQFATPQPGYHYGAPTDTAAAHEPGPTAHMHGHGHAAGSAESGLARPAGPIQPPTAAGLGDAAPTQSALEYQAAWELAMWKRAEQARWLAQLQEREAARMQELETEWRTQEVNREQVFARRQKEITKLEKKLKEALFDIEKQEKRLRLGEEELARRDANISTEIEAAKRDALLTITRLKDQHKHQIGMARMVHEELRRQYEIVKAKLAATQARFTELDEEYRLAKSRWGKSTAGQLKASLADEEAKASSTAQQLSLSQEKLRETKSQLLRALQEVARLRKQREAEQEERLQLERQDVTRLRMQYLARQQEVGVRRDAAELYSIKNELQSLLSASAATPPSSLALPVLPAAAVPYSAHSVHSLAASAPGAIGPVCHPAVATALCPHPPVAEAVPAAGAPGRGQSASALLAQLMEEGDAYGHNAVARARAFAGHPTAGRSNANADADGVDGGA